MIHSLSNTNPPPRLQHNGAQRGAPRHGVQWGLSRPTAAWPRCCPGGLFHSQPWGRSLWGTLSHVGDIPPFQRPRRALVPLAWHQGCREAWAGPYLLPCRLPHSPQLDFLPHGVFGAAWLTPECRMVLGKTLTWNQGEHRDGGDTEPPRAPSHAAAKPPPEARGLGALKSWQCHPPSSCCTCPPPCCCLPTAHLFGHRAPGAGSPRVALVGSTGRVKGGSLRWAMGCSWLPAGRTRGGL